MQYNGNPVVITRGEQGMLCGDGRQHSGVSRLSRAGLSIPRRLATFFTAHLPTEILTGLSIEETLRLAAAAAALSVTVRGGRTSIPALAQVQEMLRHAG